VPFSPSPTKKLENIEQYKHWVLSFDALHSAAHNRKSFIRYTEYQSYIIVHDQHYPIHGYGTIRVHTFENWDHYPLQKREVTLSNVLHIPALPYNVLSVDYCLRDPMNSLHIRHESIHFCRKAPFSSQSKLDDSEKTWDKPSVTLTKMSSVSYLGCYVIYQQNHPPPIREWDAGWAKFDWPEEERTSWWSEKREWDRQSFSWDDVGGVRPRRPRRYKGDGWLRRRKDEDDEGFSRHKGDIGPLEVAVRSGPVKSEDVPIKVEEVPTMVKKMPIKLEQVLIKVEE
jgi:hypothetical protein